MTPNHDPLTLRVTFTAEADEAPRFRLACQELDIDAGPFPFHDPLDEKDRAALRWYVEGWPQWPTGPDAERAAAVEAEMETWGRDLFGELFSNEEDRKAEGMRLWAQFRSADRDRLLTLDATDPQVLRLPWELLADEEGHLFGLGISIRRRLHQGQAATPRDFALPVRVLMVVARPEEPGVAFIDPRASASALLDAAEALGPENVAVEFLHPPTLKALTDRLRDRRAPAVHVVHFDGHGVYAREPGLGYLLFEDAGGGCDAVDADRLGNLLPRAHVPLVVLDACQSADADAPDPYSSIATRLIRAGVGSVVAMQYSVLVETSRRFMGAFYGALAQGDRLGRAVDEGRYELLSDTLRQKFHHPDGGEWPFHLRDWFLPALYQQQRDPAPFAGAAVAPGAAAPAPDLRGDFPAPRYGFVGRSRELWGLERLLHERRVVVLHGFGGQGKTALATEAARWLVRRGRFARACFLSFERGGDADWAVTQLGRLLRGDDFAALGADERLPTLRAALAEAPTLLVWDNFESLLPRANAELPHDALQALLDLGATLSGDPATRLLLTTRDPELPHDAFRPSQRAARLPLGGLAVGEALALAGAVLDTQGHERPPRPDLERLLRFLGGHPLSVQLVLPHLPDYPDVAAVIDHFEALYPGFTEGRAEARHESLDVSLTFSLERLSAGVRARLPALGVFTGGAIDFAIPIVAELEPATWNEVREAFVGELAQAGLLSIEMLPFPSDAQIVPVPYYRFHPTLAPHLRRRLEADERAALEARYREVYHALSRTLYYADDRSPHEARAVALRELPNLRRALDLTLAAGDLATAVDFVGKVELFLNYFGRWREREALVAKVASQMSKLESAGGLTKTEVRMESRRGELLLDQGRAGEAEGVFRRLLARMDEGLAYGGTEAGYDRAQTLWRLGRSLRDQGRPADAEGALRRALQALAGLDQDGEHREAVRRQTGVTHTTLAHALRDQGRYAEAREQYEAALEIARAQDDRRQEAVVLSQLGTLALVQGDYGEAQTRYRDALARFRALGETRSEAIGWHQLGDVAQEAAGRAVDAERAALLDDAERAYRESLRLKEALGDRAGAAQIANNLAALTKTAGRFADAERWFRRALDDFEVTDQRQYVAVTANNLADLLLSVHRLPPAGRPAPFAGRDLLKEAESWAQQAAAIMELIGDPSLQIWSTYNILAQIAGARGDAEGARAWRRRERAAYAAFPGHWARLERQWAPVVASMVAAVQGADDAWQALESQFDAMEAGNWRVTAAFRRIRDGERDFDALAEGIDRNSALIVWKVLEALTGGAAEPPPAPDPRGLSDLGGLGPRGTAGPGPAAEVHPAVRAMAPLVLGVVAAAQGQEALRPQINQALDQLAQQEDWRALAGALRRLLAGERERASLAAGLDAIDARLLDLALGALAGDAAALAQLEQLAQSAQQAQPDPAQLQDLQQAFQAWLASPAGQAALQEVEAQGLSQQAALEALLARFMQSA